MASASRNASNPFCERAMRSWRAANLSLNYSHKSENKESPLTAECPPVLPARANGVDAGRTLSEFSSHNNATHQAWTVLVTAIPSRVVDGFVAEKTRGSATMGVERHPN